MQHFFNDLIYTCFKYEHSSTERLFVWKSVWCVYKPLWVLRQFPLFLTSSCTSLETTKPPQSFCEFAPYTEGLTCKQRWSATRQNGYRLTDRRSKLVALHWLSVPSALHLSSQESNKKKCNYRQPWRWGLSSCTKVVSKYILLHLVLFMLWIVA